MEKTELRNKLFEKYFEVENGVLATDLVDKLSFIPKLWEELRALCQKNIKYFEWPCTLHKFQIVEHKQRKYLILKLGMLEYVIIDLEKMANISEVEFRSEFDEDFFITYFDETKEEEDYFPVYNLFSYDGNVQELVDFYTKNHDLFALSTYLYYRLDEGEAWTYFYIDFANPNAQIGFQTADQFLYEQLHFKYDLTPFGMQDAHEKMGIEKMQEMLTRIKDLRIPVKAIPLDLYGQYLAVGSLGTPQK